MAAGASSERPVWREPAAVAAMLPGRWQRTCNGARACCPCHADTEPSLDIAEKDGTLVFHCKVCGADRQKDIAAALRGHGVALSRGEADRSFKPTKTKPLGIRKLVATHYATDAQGDQTLRKERFEYFDPYHGKRVGREKDFVWAHKTGHNGSAKWETGIGGQAPPLYRLHELLRRAGEDVHFCEGELKADRLAQLGLAATSLMTKRKDLPDLSALQGRRILVHVDNDDSGEDQAATIAKALRQIGCRVILVRYPDCGPKGDVKDFLEKEGRGTRGTAGAMCRGERGPISDALHR